MRRGGSAVAADLLVDIQVAFPRAVMCSKCRWVLMTSF